MSHQLKPEVPTGRPVTLSSEPASHTSRLDQTKAHLQKIDGLLIRPLFPFDGAVLSVHTVMAQLARGRLNKLRGSVFKCQKTLSVDELDPAGDFIFV